MRWDGYSWKKIYILYIFYFKFVEHKSIVFYNIKLGDNTRKGSDYKAAEW